MAWPVNRPTLLHPGVEKIRIQIAGGFQESDKAGACGNHWHRRQYVSNFRHRHGNHWLPGSFVAGFTGPELVTAIIRGDIDITTLPLVSAFVTAVDSREAVSLGVYGPGKHPLWPDYKSDDELGFPQLKQQALVGETLYALPPGTPPAIANKLGDVLNKIMADEKVVKKVEGNGNLVRPLSAADTGKLLNDMVELVEKHKSALAKHVKN